MLYQIRIKRNKWDDLRICCQQQNKLQIYTIVSLSTYKLRKTPEHEVELYF
jgi:hypothetical protein